MGVLRGLAVAVLRHKGLTQIHAAGKTYRAIHNQQFAVTAQIGVGHAQKAQGVGHEQGAAYAFAAQQSHNGRTRIFRPDGIDQHTNLHATLMGARQGADKFTPQAIAIEDIALQGNGAVGLINGFQHGRISLIAADQNAHIIAIA